ncbi:MAG: galactokinase [Candidatus Binatia bacterium]|nr:MAG: galactokinase [Candidatus Binatia bacterium]
MNPQLSIEPFSGLLPSEQQQIRAVAEEFRALFGRKPHFVVLAPGRVNLIGEHTDYNGYPVLPAAIDRAMLVATAPRRDDVVVARSTAPGTEPVTFSLAQPLRPNPEGHWGNYIKAAALPWLARSEHVAAGADLLVKGHVPAGAGLSSSSALVVGAGLAFLAAHGATDANLLTLAEEFAEAERFVGTMSGGMDQTCCLFGKREQLLRIEFFPVRVRPVPFPTGYHIVVCHSLVKAEKSAGAREAYNQRVRECAVAARCLALLLGETEPRRFTRLAEIERTARALRRWELLDLLVQRIPDRPVTPNDLAALLGATVDDLVADIPGLTPDLPLLVLRRARHVFSEADRVDIAERALWNADIGTLHAAMKASHESCRDDYEVSCPALEVLVRVATEAGAIGARLTGAGFGGCTVQLVPSGALAEFFQRVDREFYAPRLPSGDAPMRWRFAFLPDNGARVVRVE